MNLNRSTEELDCERQSIVQSTKRKRLPTPGADEAEEYDLTQPKLQRRLSSLQGGFVGDEGPTRSPPAGRNKEDDEHFLLGEKPAARPRPEVQVQVMNQAFSPLFPGQLGDTNDAFRQTQLPGARPSLGISSSFFQQGGSQAFTNASRTAPSLHAYGYDLPTLVGVNPINLQDRRVPATGQQDSSAPEEEKLKPEASSLEPTSTTALDFQLRDGLRNPTAPLFSPDQLLTARAQLLQQAHFKNQVQMATLLSSGGITPSLPGSIHSIADPSGRSLLFPNPAMVEAQTRANLMLLQNQMAGLPPHLLGSRQQPHQFAMLGGGVFPFGNTGSFAAAALPSRGIATAQTNPENQEILRLPPLEPGQHPPVNLYMSCDDEILSDHQIFLRKQIEYFEASTLEVQSATHGRRREIHMGQVGIRCKHCAIIPTRRRSKGAVYYPASLRALYQAAQNMAAGHFSSSSCEMISEEKKAQFKSFQTGKISAGHGGKKYWSDCAKAAGIYETEKGLRFNKEEQAGSESSS